MQSADSMLHRSLSAYLGLPLVSSMPAVASLVASVAIKTSSGSSRSSGASIEQGAMLSHGRLQARPRRRRRRRAATKAGACTTLWYPFCFLPPPVHDGGRGDRALLNSTRTGPDRWACPPRQHRSKHARFPRCGSTRIHDAALLTRGAPSLGCRSEEGFPAPRRRSAAGVHDGDAGRTS